MKYFFTRKLMFVKECHAVCLLPGGFGTLDEGMEVLTLVQTGKRDMVPVVFLDEPGGDYWAHFQRFIEQKLLARGMIDPADLSLYKLTDSVDEAVDEILRFFHVVPQHAVRSRQAGAAAERADRRRAARRDQRATSPTSWSAAGSPLAVP